MVYVRGNPNDDTRWASYCLKDWSYEKVLTYFNKLETLPHGENDDRVIVFVVDKANTKAVEKLFAVGFTFF